MNTVTKAPSLTNEDVIELAAAIPVVNIEKIPVRFRRAWIENQNRTRRAAEPINEDLNALAYTFAKREDGKVVTPKDKDGHDLGGFIIDDVASHTKQRRAKLNEPFDGTLHLRLLPVELFDHLSSQTDHPTEAGKTLPAVPSEILSALYPLFDFEDDEEY